MELDHKTKILKGLAITALLIFSIQSFSNNKADVDLWGNVGFVKAMPWSPEFHRENTFSFTDQHHSWINHEWLSEYILNKIHDTAGNAGLLGIKILLGMFIIILLAHQVIRNCSTPLLQFLFLALTISTMGYGFSIRPHLFTYLMIAMFLTLLKDHAHRQPASLMFLPVLGIIWTNLHGAFFTGIILMAVYTFSEYVKLLKTGRVGQEKLFSFMLPAICVFLIAVSFLNPYGPQLWNFIVESAATSRPYLSEWAPFHPVKGFWDHSDFMALSAISFGTLLFSRRPKDPTWICILVISFISALVLRRNIPIFAIVASFVIPEHIDDIARKKFESISGQVPKTLAIVLTSMLILVSTSYTLKFQKTNPFEIEVPKDRFPVNIVSFIKQHHIQGNMFVFFDWAEYCIWKLYPDCPVFLDGRFTDAYSRETITDYLNLLYGREGWENTLRKYPIDMLLIHKKNPSYRIVSDLKDWKILCENDIAALFLRKDIYSSVADRIQGEKPFWLDNPAVSFFP